MAVQHLPHRAVRWVALIFSEWNELRVGDRVQVHDPPFPASKAALGEVTEIKNGPGGANRVGVRLFDRQRRLLWPTRNAVHRSERPDACWRCRAVLDPDRTT